MTQKRIDANRRNATHSTGPRTPEGKAKVRLNALRYGFRARDETWVAAGGEEARRFIAGQIADISKSLHPVGPEENALVAEIALNVWKSEQIFALEMHSRWWKMGSDPEWPRIAKWVYALMRYANRTNRIIDRGFDALLTANHARRRALKNERTNPLARHRHLSSPASSAGEAVTAPARGDGEGSVFTPAVAAAPPTFSKNERTNPLAPHRHPSSPASLAGEAVTAPGRGDGEGSVLTPAVAADPPAYSENERTNPLANEPPKDLRGLTFSFWDRERGRAEYVGWQKRTIKPTRGLSSDGIYSVPSDATD